MHGIERSAVDDLGHVVIDDLRSLLAFADLAVVLVEAARAGIGLARQHFMHGAGPEQRPLAGPVAMLVEPDRNLLRAQGTAGPVAIPCEIECQPDDFGLDRLDRQLLLLLVPDDVGIDRFEPEGNVAAIGVAQARIGQHGPGCRARGLLGLHFVDDTDELSEHVARIIVGERFNMRDQLDAMFAQSLNRQFLLDLIPKGPRKRIDEDRVHRTRAVGRPRDHILEGASLHVGAGLALVTEDADDVVAVALAPRHQLRNLVVQAQQVLGLGQSRNPSINQDVARTRFNGVVRRCGDLKVLAGHGNFLTRYGKRV
nr:hypothetical protein [Bradyrhizobium barranii]